MSASFLTSLSPAWGFDPFTTPNPQSFWLTLVQKLNPGIRSAGSTKPGLWQHSSLTGQCMFGLAGVHVPPAPVVQSSHPPWMAAHLSRAPHAMQTPCSQVGNVPAVTVKVVVFAGLGCVMPPESTHGVCLHEPATPPQKASLVQMAKRF